MTIQIKQLGCCDYWDVWQKMQEFTATRNTDTPDEIWLVEHPPVFTQGQAGKPEHILNPGGIPVVQTDRGGQVTYHGPGQCVAYPLIDLRRLHFSIRQLVSALETAVIKLLADYNIPATTQCNAPGVYVADQKICSIGLRVKRGCSYHGLALNVAMDLTPFSGINPCGMQQLQMTQIRNFVPDITLAEVQSRIATQLCQQLRPHEVPA